MHERTVFLHVVNEDVPRVADGERVHVTRLAPGLYNVDARFGFREEPDVPAALALAAAQGLDLEPMSTTFFVARSSIVDSPRASCRALALQPVYGWCASRRARPATSGYRPTRWWNWARR